MHYFAILQEYINAVPMDKLHIQFLALSGHNPANQNINLGKVFIFIV